MGALAANCANKNFWGPFASFAQLAAKAKKLLSHLRALKLPVTTKPDQ